MSRYAENSSKVALVWELHDQRWSQYQIADAVGIPRASIQSILKRPRPQEKRYDDNGTYLNSAEVATPEADSSAWEYVEGEW